MAYSDSEILDILEDFPHGGGEYYTEEEGKLDPDDADVTVSTLSELESEVGSDQMVFVDSNIDMTGAEVDIGQSTVYGDRGWPDGDGGISDGAALHTDTEGHTSGGTGSDRPYSMLYSTTTDGNPRVSGLRLSGASSDRDDYAPAGDSSVYEQNLARGITYRGNGGEIDNCEIYGFMWTGVHIKGWSSVDRWTDDVHIHHCHFHTSKQDGYGYGIDFWLGYGEIDHCYFNDQRHSIDGQGRYRCGYHAEEIITGPDQLSHTIDMHCLTENSISCQNDDPSAEDYGIRAGGSVITERSTFLHDSSGVATARGIPWEEFEVVDCWISRDIPTSNSGNNRSGAWYQQNIHGVTGSGCGEQYSAHASDGDFTDEWSTSGNEDGANDPSVSWTEGVGASVDFETPENSPAYQGYASDPDPPEPEEYTLTAVVEDESSDPITHAEVAFDGEDAVSVDSSGEAAFEELEDGTYDLDVSASGYLETSVTVEIDGEDHTETVELEEGEDEWYLETDADGIVDFGALEYDQTFRYEISASGYQDASDVYLNDSDDTHTIEMTPEDGIPEPDEGIVVTVTTRDDTALEDVEVTLFAETDGTDPGDPDPDPDPDPDGGYNTGGYNEGGYGE